ncbi:MAG: trehalose-phosphatase [Proteobacteria bacterium]|nr:trehalose-phosphatase [Pseudomonadota bacterium]
MDVQPPPLTPDVALFLDFDGTLVEIASSPNTVKVASGLNELLSQVAWRLNGALAVITGRPIEAIDKHLNGSVRAVAGIHGAERRTALGHIIQTEIPAQMLDPAREALSEFCRTHPGVMAEDKGISIALHYRNAPSLGAKSRAIIDECAAASHSLLERLDGNMVVELKPAAVRKAVAMSAYMNEPPFAGRRPVFVGDDLTDESAFIAVSQTNGYGVIVGPRTPTAASSRLASVAALHAWLMTLNEQNDGRRAI